MTEGFANEPALELRRAPERERLLEALGALDARLPLRAPLAFGGTERDGEALVSTDPADPSRVVALAPRATAQDATAAVEAVARGAAAWAATPADDRAAALLRAAQHLRGRRHELAALCVREVGKTWAEADADVCEAIDFLELYARAAPRLATPTPLLEVPGERNRQVHRPRGVCAVIAPWNFPLAIPCGMAAAALATGNAVVLKPAEQAPGAGAEVARALWAGGVPRDALALVPGEAEAGRALVEHPDVATIAFTGSGAVGLEIAGAAGRLAPGQRHLKRAVIEMGGKNCIVVAPDADLDDAVPAIVRSAFAFAGQKCSAASRVLACGPVHDALLERLAGAVEVLQVGAPEHFATEVGPVVEAEAQQRLRAAHERAGAEGRVAARGAEGPDVGWYVPPVVAAGLPDASPLLRDELFGPFLAVERVRDVDEACDRVDALPVALTGGLFTRDPRTVARVTARSPVGNLYVNRAITGAMVGRQPFGGNRLSGTGTKAGGADYLLQFVAAQVVSEETVRHGLVL